MNLRNSIRQTKAYASFFGFSLFPREIHHWIISPSSVSWKRVSKNTEMSLSNDEIALRRNRTFSSLEKVRIARRLGRVVGRIPGIRLIALTGSVAANNSYSDDDIDLMVVTSDGVLWIVRPLFLLLTGIFFRRRLPHEDPFQTRDAFCPNLWLDLNHLRLPKGKRNLYTAHEILQVVPIVDGGGIYQSFISQNPWTKKYLANAFLFNSCSVAPGKHNKCVSLFLSYLLMPLNLFLYFAQLIYMYPKKTSESVTLHSAYLHTNNYTSKINKHISSPQDI